MENVFDQCVRSPAALSFVQGVGMHQTKCIGFSMGRLLIIEKVSCSTGWECHHKNLDGLKNLELSCWSMDFEAILITKVGFVSLLHLRGWNVCSLDIPMSVGHSNSELQIFQKNVSFILKFSTRPCVCVGGGEEEGENTLNYLVPSVLEIEVLQTPYWLYFRLCGIFVKMFSFEEN